MRIREAVESAVALAAIPRSIELDVEAEAAHFDLAIVIDEDHRILTFIEFAVAGNVRVVDVIGIFAVSQIV